MKTILRALAIFIVPFTCLCALGSQTPTADVPALPVGELILLYIFNTVFFALPQIIWSAQLLILGEKAVPIYYRGGLATCHLLIIAFTWYVIHLPGDKDATWVFGYYILSVPAIALGACIGNLLKRLSSMRRF